MLHCYFNRFSLRERDAPELNRITGFELTKLPAFCFRHNGWANKSTQARAIGAQQNGHVAGEVDGADGIRIVVDV